MIEQIEQVIKEKINPVLELHRGSCELVSVEEGVVSVKLNGGCAGCPSAKLTMLNGVVPILKENVQGVTEVLLEV